MPGADAAVQINRGRRHAPTSCSRLRRRRPCRLRHRLHLSGRLRRLLLRTAFGRLLRLRLRCALRQHPWLPALLAWRPGHRIRLRLRRLRVRLSLWLPRRWLSLLPAILVVSPASAPPARKTAGGRRSAARDRRPPAAQPRDDGQPDPAQPGVGDPAQRPDRKSVVSEKSVSVRVDLGGRRIIKKKTNKYKHT